MNVEGLIQLFKLHRGQLLTVWITVALLLGLLNFNVLRAPDSFLLPLVSLGLFCFVAWGVGCATQYREVRKELANQLPPPFHNLDRPEFAMLLLMARSNKRVLQANRYNDVILSLQDKGLLKPYVPPSEPMPPGSRLPFSTMPADVRTYMISDRVWADLKPHQELMERIIDRDLPKGSLERACFEDMMDANEESLRDWLDT